eukprot:CAMPEP_0194367666 /NCGR_PEP_ID=MMETSP0174-20130528/15800_1 /TAXON_ID=216777 /ORGANISM="Proboscia alata, Strain PI-D3" /LENGTH=256 /DNA_ID=CAMNT_0039143579 /DNA_START=320 /DNA_END=1087 /DNA_ORIENTATION=+
MTITTWNWSKESNDTANETTSTPQPEIDPTVQASILTSVSTLHKSIMPINTRLHGPLPRHSHQSTSLPFVFLVGNHSSGKSSFINHVMGRSVQTAGVAPTDDTFTVICPSEALGTQQRTSPDGTIRTNTNTANTGDYDRDGPALIGDPDMGFENLRQFGPTLVHHTQLKIRSNINNNNFMLVDSPGMIDSPMSSSGMGGDNSSAQLMDRGYDFAGVVRWFAERADVVLLFFDPDKPGTTGETLSILLKSLSGMDHK